MRSELDGKLYIGYTSDLKNRVREHKRGEVVSTKHRRPFDLVFYEAYKSVQDALRREKYFKTGKGKSSLRMMLQNSLDTRQMLPGAREDVFIQE
ncbi:MAG TPA: GIY-YIG nuclease family protein [Thermodesulfobacteriota bacterium]|nr:GIY-YIG nuclease family protein [Thermodesulfobacteriota bacterium]